MAVRTIIFRGKRFDGKWVEGSYCHAEKLDRSGDEHFIIEYSANGSSYRVDPATVGQYTGLKDKNGKRIFEGDIVAQNWHDHDEPADDSFGEVVFCEYDCSLSVMDVNKDGIVPLGRCSAYHWEAEVIGNIHDNPELLEGGNEE